jgi:hypothetical protein
MTRTVRIEVTVEYDPTALNRSDVARAVNNAVDALNSPELEIEAVDVLP